MLDSFPIAVRFSVAHVSLFAAYYTFIFAPPFVGGFYFHLSSRDKYLCVLIHRSVETTIQNPTGPLLCSQDPTPSIGAITNGPEIKTRIPPSPYSEQQDHILLVFVQCLGEPFMGQLLDLHVCTNTKTFITVKECNTGPPYRAAGKELA